MTNKRYIGYLPFYHISEKYKKQGRLCYRIKKIFTLEKSMKLKAAQSLYEEYKVMYEERDAENRVNQEKFFLNSLEVVHLPPFDDSSYEVILYAIKEGKVITFKIIDAIRVFGKLE